MTKTSTLLAGMSVAAGKVVPSGPEKAEARQPARSATRRLTMIGAHYPSEVRRALKLLEAETGRRLKPLLAEAINDLCAKYGKPQPCTVED